MEENLHLDTGFAVFPGRFPAALPWTEEVAAGSLDGPFLGVSPKCSIRDFAGFTLGARRPGTRAATNCPQKGCISVQEFAVSCWCPNRICMLSSIRFNGVRFSTVWHLKCA